MYLQKMLRAETIYNSCRLLKTGEAHQASGALGVRLQKRKKSILIYDLFKTWPNIQKKR